MHIAIVNEGLCYPPTAGNRIRTLNLMLRLARRHRITYLCRGDVHSTEADAARTFLGDHGIDLVIAHDPFVPKTGASFAASLALNLLSPLPYAVATHNSPALRRALAVHARSRRVELWQFEWLAYADALQGDPSARTVAIAHNVESLIWQRYVEAELRFLQRWYLTRQWRKFERYEKKLLATATRVVAVSSDDARLLRQSFGLRDVDVVDNGIDRAYFEEVKSYRDPKQVLFLGSLEWRPNLDAVGLLLDRIFPAVLAQQPDARLCIVGRNPSPALVRRVATLPWAELHADVADVRPYLARSGVLAVPLRIGGGSRLKILEALACGTPVVSTRVGAEGLCLRPGTHHIEVESVDGMAEALVCCLRDPAPVQEMARNGRALVLERYDWEALAVRLEQVWERCCDSPTQARSASAGNTCSLACASGSDARKEQP
jgi:glycosyltransferase involved in cell wall biosynthesis